jgi:cyclopropane-fatty-acyl-phospholipid synthase
MTDAANTFCAPAMGPGCLIARGFMKRLMQRLQVGDLTIITPQGETIRHCAPVPGPEARLVLNRWRPIWRLIFGGGIGFAESYIDGDWTSPDLTTLLSLLARNRDGLMPVIAASRTARIANRLRHAFNANTRRGSSRNIVAHYDLGNDFYRRWLDEGMQYSSALYEGASRSLEAAQQAKLDLIVQKLALTGGERVLEIGCGWGALAERLVAEGCHVTGITLSPAQLAFARERLSAAEAEGGADLRLQDYRDVTGKFDRVVSIEMIEAVGRDYWPTYFATLRHCLAPGGRAVIQAITIDEPRYEGYRSRVDFIQRYIFPGGMLPTKSIIAERTAEVGLTLEDTRLFGISYAETLAEWNHRFQTAWPSLARSGHKPNFKRLWEYYLAYCEVGFRLRDLDVGLYTIKRERNPESTGRSRSWLADRNQFPTQQWPSTPPC